MWHELLAVAGDSSNAAARWNHGGGSPGMQVGRARWPPVVSVAGRRRQPVDPFVMLGGNRIIVVYHHLALTRTHLHASSASSSRFIIIVHPRSSSSRIIVILCIIILPFLPAGSHATMAVLTLLLSCSWFKQLLPGHHGRAIMDVRFPWEVGGSVAG